MNNVLNGDSIRCCLEGLFLWVQQSSVIHVGRLQGLLQLTISHSNIDNCQCVTTFEVKLQALHIIQTSVLSISSADHILP
jgi:hypothetical protein